MGIITISYKNIIVWGSVFAAAALTFLVSFSPDLPQFIVPCLAMAFAAFLFADVRFESSRMLFREIRVFILIMNAFICLYILGSGEGILSAGEGIVYVPYSGYIALFAFLVSTRFYSFSVIPPALLIWKKAVFAEIAGFNISPTDWAIISELPLFLVFYTYIYGFAGVVWNKLLKQDEKGRLLEITAKDIAVPIMFVLCLHFTNYFYAGFEKLYIAGPGWVTNTTQNIFFTSLLLEQNPFAEFLGLNFDDSVTFFNTYHLKWVVLFANCFVLFLQVSCVFALFKHWSIKIYLVLFDVFHIGVLLASGIFFYKWIFLNLALLAIASNKNFVKEHEEWGLPTKAVFIACLSIIPFFFYIPRLGWLDSNVVPRVSVYGVSENGEEHRLHSNFFREYSVTFAQQRVRENHIRSYGTYGATKQLDKVSRECGDIAKTLKMKSNIEGDDLGKFFNFFHSGLLAKEKDEEIYYSNLYPHHIWSHLGGGDVPLSEISSWRGYRVNLDILCYDPEGKLSVERLEEKYYPLD